VGFSRNISAAQRLDRSRPDFAAHGRPRTPADFAQHNCLAFTLRETRLARAWAFVRDGAEITHAPQGNVSFSDGAALCEAACAGLGLAQLHGYYIDAALAAGRLETVLEKFKPKADPTGWCIRRRATSRPRSARLSISWRRASASASDARPFGMLCRRLKPVWPPALAIAGPNL
jgi:DNA-binding transcriptional LysR family regulator